MSFEYISQSFEKVREHVRDFPLAQDKMAYQVVRKRVEDVRHLYLKWIDVYQEYTRGFEKEELTLSLYPVRRLLSNLGIGLEESFFEVIRSRMPVELYLLLEDYNQKFDCDPKFVLAEGRGFESHTVYSEISEELEKLTAPKPIGTQAETHLASIKSGDYSKVYYESGTYDSPLTWPLLLHELFHAVYDKEKLSRLKLSSSATWLPEVIIDLYAAIFFGPVYAVSLAKYHERFPGGGGVSHPHQGPRLYALLQFLLELVDKISTFPKTVQNIISSSFDSTTKIWSQYSKEKTDLQDKMSKVYPEIKESCLKLLETRKLLSFQDFTKDSINTPEGDFEAIKLCYQLGIPTEADPRVLFNTLLLSEVDPHPLYVTESLKRWYLTALWHRSESAVAGTLFSG